TVHLDRLWPALQAGGRAALHGLGRRRVRQCPVRIFLRHARDRAARARAVPESSRGEDEDLRFHRRLVQSAPAPLCAWTEITDPVRTPARARGVTAGGRVIHTLLLRSEEHTSELQSRENLV